MILLLHKIDILTNKTFIEERNIRKKVTKFSSHDEITHFDGTALITFIAPPPIYVGRLRYPSSL